jgi:hypothetical protein
LYAGTSTGCTATATCTTKAARRSITAFRLPSGKGLVPCSTKLAVTGANFVASWILGSVYGLMSNSETNCDQIQDWI